MFCGLCMELTASVYVIFNIFVPLKFNNFKLTLFFCNILFSFSFYFFVIFFYGGFYVFARHKVAKSTIK